jgi:hypothetical protein
MKFTHVVTLTIIGVGALLAQTVKRPPIPRYFFDHQTKNPIYTEAIDLVVRALGNIHGKQLQSAGGVGVFVTAFNDQLPLSLRLLKPETCVANTKSFESPVVICNEAFLVELEAAIRIFEPGDRVMQEEKLVTFVRNVSNNPERALKEIRADTSLSVASNQTDNHIADHMRVLLLFLVSHEIGHVLSHDEVAGFTPQTAATDERIEFAKANMCRHADEFNRNGFFLFGGSPDKQTWSDLMTKDDPELAARLRSLYSATSRAWDSEVQADRFAARTAQTYLETIDKANARLGAQEQQLFFETLFVASVYNWYRDLTAFADDACGGPFKNARAFQDCLTEDRRRYLQASRLFGETHRFMMVRSLQTLEGLLKGRRTSFWMAAPLRDGLNEQQADEARRSLGLLAARYRFELLTNLQDTPLKLSMAGCEEGFVTKLLVPGGKITFILYRLEDEIAAVERKLGLTADPGRPVQKRNVPR